MVHHILVVEDTTALRFSMVELFEMEGFIVHAAPNGNAALQILNGTPVQIIITDLLMPEMNGFDFITRVRENTAWNEILILVFSAMPPHENEQKVLRLGANAYLKKPSTLEELLDVVKNLIG